MKFRISTCMAGIALACCVRNCAGSAYLTNCTNHVQNSFHSIRSAERKAPGTASTIAAGLPGRQNQPGDNVSHAALWVGGPQMTDLGALGGQSFNSAVAWPVKANNGVVVGISDTDRDQPPCR